MAILAELAPQRFFHYFEEISSIPRPSYHEQAMSQYLVDFAHAHQLECYQDARWNVVMIKEATKGYEKEPPLILQGHMDMICEKLPDCPKDMKTEGLDIWIDGDFVKAKGTTLGADDGMAIAFMLSLLEDETLSHPRLECVITTAEETGMEGAHEIDLSMLKGRTLINLDSSEESVLTVGCAGGGRLGVNLPIHRSKAAKSGKLFDVHVQGCTGGHSGIEIHKGGANAVIVLIQILLALSKEIDIQLSDLSAGEKDNAIPREAVATVFVEETRIKDFKDLLLSISRTIKEPFQKTDASMEVFCVQKEGSEDVLSVDETKACLTLIKKLPNGVQKMRNTEPVFVEVSLNLGVVKMDDRLKLRYCARSNVPMGYEKMHQELQQIGETFGATVYSVGEYPSWEYQPNSPIRDRLQDAYQKLFGKTLKAEVVHAGLECGILGDKLPCVDTVSMGADALDIHTPKERLSISSVQRVDRLLRYIIEQKEESIGTESI